MADFKDVVEEIKKTNQAIDNLTQATDPKGAGATEDKRDAEQWKTNQLNYLKTIADAVGGGGGGGGGAGPSEDKKSGGMLTGIAGALGRMGSSVGKGIGGFVKGIGGAAGGAAQFAFVMTAVGAGIAGFITALGVGAALTAKMMPTIAEGLKSFDGINGANLGKVGKGMGHLGVGLASMGTGGAIAGIGGLIGNIADGIGGLFGAESGQEQLMDKLKKFSEVKLNVKNIKDNSEAMVAYGIAMTAGSAGTMMGSLSTLADGAIGGLGRLLGGVPVVTQLINFSKVDIDGVKVKKNADAMVSYAAAMTAGAGATAMSSVAGVFTMITSFTDGVSNLLGGKGVLDTQLESLKKMSAASDSIDGTKIKSVAGAMVWYAAAMTAGAGAEAVKSVGGVGNLVTSFTDGVSKLLGGEGVLDTQLKSLKKISAAEGIDGAKIKLVAEAMVTYAGAMTAGTGATAMTSVGSVLNMVTGFTDGVSKLLGGEGVLDTQLKGMQKMTAADGIDGVKIKVVAAALVDYAEAMATGAKGEAGKAGASIGNFVGTAVDGLTSFITGGDKKVSTLDTMLTSLKTISAADGINGPKIKIVATALVDYAAAMASGAKGEAGKAGASIGTFVGSAVDGLTSLITGDKKVSTLSTLLTSLQTMSAAEGIDGAKIKLVAQAMVAYSDAMAAGAKSSGGKLIGDIAGFASGAVKALGSFFGIGDEKADPLGDLKKFAATVITEKEVTQIKLNASGISTYADAMVNMGKITVGKGFGDTLSNVFSGIGSLFGGSGEKSPMTALQNFASANIDSAKIKKDITALLSVLEDPNVDLKKSWTFKTILTNISKGLEKFTAPGGFVGLLASAGNSMLQFLTGDKSPIEQIQLIAGKSQELKDGAEAIDKISVGLEKMAGLKFDGSDIKIESFSKDLLESIPNIEAAIMGGEIEVSGFNPKVKGLASKDIKWADAAKNIKVLKEALYMQVSADMGGMGGAGDALKGPNINKLTVNTLVAEKLISRAVEKSAAGQGTSTNIVDASVSNTQDARKMSANFNAANTQNTDPTIAALNYPG